MEWKNEKIINKDRRKNNLFYWLNSYSQVQKSKWLVKMLIFLFNTAIPIMNFIPDNNLKEK